MRKILFILGVAWCNLGTTHANTTKNCTREIGLCVAALKENKTLEAMSILNSLPYAPDRVNEETDIDEVTSVIEAVVHLQGSKLNLLVQQALAKCLLIIARLQQQGAVLQHEVLEQITTIVRLSLNLIVASCLENISLHFPKR